MSFVKRGGEFLQCKVVFLELHRFCISPLL
jgi:hypothetical protein